ncbi:MAG: ABC transporter permease, partial [Bacteroidetes bacterium]|nr:ABC transporter permease [Bacteroidota bacterium]
MTLKNVFRIIRRDSLSLITNTTGLSLGLAASILLTAFILFELSYDRHFSQANRICRLNSIWIESGEKEIWPINLREAYTDIPEQVTGIETTVQMYRGFRRELTLNENRYQGLQLLYVDPDFFSVFDLDLLEGNPHLALRETNGVILTEKIARRIFGTTQVTGHTLEMEGKTYT